MGKRADTKKQSECLSDMLPVRDALDVINEKW
jgi:hypothetical protein